MILADQQDAVGWTSFGGRRPLAGLDDRLVLFAAFGIVAQPIGFRLAVEGGHDQEAEDVADGRVAGVNHLRKALVQRQESDALRRRIRLVDDVRLGQRQAGRVEFLDADVDPLLLLVAILFHCEAFPVDGKLGGENASVPELVTVAIHGHDLHRSVAVPELPTPVKERKDSQEDREAVGAGIDRGHIVFPIEW